MCVNYGFEYASKAECGIQETAVQRIQSLTITLSLTLNPRS